MKKIVLNKKNLQFEITMAKPYERLCYNNNDIIEHNEEMIIYCESDILINEYKYKLLNRIQRRIGKQLFDIKEEKEKISNGFNPCFGRLNTLKDRLAERETEYKMNNDKCILEEIKQLREVIEVKERVEC